MNYYKITLTRRGKRSYEVLKARSKISAIRQAKQEFKGFNVVKAERDITRYGHLELWIS